MADRNTVSSILACNKIRWSGATAASGSALVKSRLAGPLGDEWFTLTTVPDLFSQIVSGVAENIRSTSSCLPDPNALAMYPVASMRRNVSGGDACCDNGCFFMVMQGRCAVSENVSCAVGAFCHAGFKQVTKLSLTGTASRAPAEIAGTYEACCSYL